MKRLMSMCLVASLSMGLLAGCTGDKNAEKTEGKQTVTNEAGETVEKPMDVQLWSMKDLKYFDEDNYMTNYLQDKYNVKIEYLSRPGSDVDWGTKVRLALAGGDAPDHFSDVYPQDFDKYYSQGIIRDIPVELVEQYAPKYMAWIKKHLGEDPFKYVRQEDGKIYALPKPWTPASTARVLSYRKDWAEKVGVTEAPKTLEEVEVLFKKLISEDPDGNGKDDTFAMTAAGSTREKLMESFGFIFGAYGVYPGIFTTEDGKVVRGELQDGAKEALEVIRDWYAKGYIDKEFMVNKSANFNEAIFTGKAAGGVYSWYHFAPPGVFYGGKYYKHFNGEVEFEICAAPAGPRGQAGYINPSPQSHTGLIFFDHVSDEKLIKYLQIFDDGAFDTETYAVVSRGEEGTTYKKVTDDNGEVYYEWLAPYDTDEEARFEFGTGNLATVGNFWNDYDFQRPFIVEPQYRQLNVELFQVSTGRYDELTTIVKPVFNEYKEVLDQILAENYIKFITGERSLDEYDQFLAEYKAAGADLVMEEAQQLYDKYNK